MGWCFVKTRLRFKAIVNKRKYLNQGILKYNSDESKNIIFISAVQLFIHLISPNNVNHVVNMYHVLKLNLKTYFFCYKQTILCNLYQHFLTSMFWTKLIVSVFCDVIFHHISLFWNKQVQIFKLLCITTFSFVGKVSPCLMQYTAFHFW
jgi:hypothetical protein